MLLTSSDGTRIAYDMQGKGPALLLLPGLAEQRKIWHVLGYVDRLCSDFQVITFDRRGMGESDAPTDPEAYSLEKMLDDIYRVADACHAEHFLLWGHSFGGSQVLQLAARSRRVTRAVVAGSFFGRVYPEERVGPIVEELQELLAAQQEGRLEQLGLSSEEMAWMEQRNIAAMIACWQASIAWPPVEPQDILCPILIYAGIEDHRVVEPLIAREKEIEAAGITLKIFQHLDHEQEIREKEVVFPTASAFLQRTLL
jgi:pimeloyl-ACP methyl ester carboxylesterase